MLLPRNHGPEAVPQTGGVPHGTCGGVPRLVNGVHIAHPNVDKVIQGGVIERHIVRATLPLQFLVLKLRSSRSRTIHARDNPHKG